MEFSVQQLSLQQAFNILYASLEEYLDPNIPLRIRASPIDPNVTCFYVIDPKHFQFEQNAAASGNENNGYHNHNGNGTGNNVNGCMPMPSVHLSGSSSLSERVRRHLNLETNEARIEQENLRANRGGTYDVASANSGSNGNGTVLKKRKVADNANGNSRGLGDSNHWMNESDTQMQVSDEVERELISVKYQSFHGKNTEFWWSKQHNSVYGLAVRNMGRNARKPRKLGRLQSNQSDEEDKDKSKKHGYAGRIFSLICRYQPGPEAEHWDWDNTKEWNNQKVRKLLVNRVPSLVQFWRTEPNRNYCYKGSDVMTFNPFTTMNTNTGENGNNYPAFDLTSNNSNVMFATNQNHNHVQTSSHVSIKHESPGYTIHPDNRNGYGGFGVVPEKGIHAVMDLSVQSVVHSPGCGNDQLSTLHDDGLNEIAHLFDGSVEEQEMDSHSSVTVNTATKIYDKDVVVYGDLIVQSDTTVRNLHVKGNLLVEGTISGQLVTPTGAADYAEWFAILNPKEETIKPGMVVQLRSPEQKITLDTSHHGPHMVVSTSPSIAAGLPPNRVPGALCAFIGQVPVLVHGPVECGDLLFPSGNNDGYAVNHLKHYRSTGLQYIKVIDDAMELAKKRAGTSKENEPIATALMSCPEGKHTILSFIRWQHNLKHQIIKENEKSVSSASGMIWFTRPLQIMLNSLAAMLYFGRDGFYFEKAFILIEFAFVVSGIFHFPNYESYFKRGDCLFYLAYRLFVFTYSFYALSVYLGDDTSYDPTLNVKLVFMTILTILVTILAIVSSVILINSLARSYPEKTHPRVKLFVKLAADIVEWFPNSRSNLDKQFQMRFKKEA